MSYWAEAVRRSAGELAGGACGRKTAWVTLTNADLIARADELANDGRALEAIAVLTDVNRKQPDPTIEGALVRLRSAAWNQVDRTGSTNGLDPIAPDRFAGVAGIPEVTAADLDATVIRSAIEHHGALLVRGLLPPHRCSRLRDCIDHSWEAIERFRATKERDPAWFDPLMEGGFGRDLKSRMWGMVTGTAYVADSPRLFFELLEAFDEIGIKQMIAEYFGEAPVLSLAKTAHRRLPPDASGGWHQDAAVYGMAAHALDLWLPVSRCGDVAPGLALWPRRLDRVVDTVGAGATEFGTSPAALAEFDTRRTSRVPSIPARRRRDPRRADPALDAVEPELHRAAVRDRVLVLRPLDVPRPGPPGAARLLRPRTTS